MKYINKSNENEKRSPEEIEKMIEEASKHYGNFLKSMGFDYEKDRQTIDTPKRVAKAWLKDLIIGSITDEPAITVFPNDEKYDGVVIQTGIPVVSMCAHHNLPFTGYASVAPVTFLRAFAKRSWAASSSIAALTPSTANLTA